MAIEVKYQDLAGMWRVLWSFLDGTVVLFKYDHDPTTEEVETTADTYIIIHQYDIFPQIIISIYLHRQVIEDAVTFIKTTNPTLTQWNTYLALLPWYHANLVRFFVFALATGLAERKDIDLDNLTEVEVLSKLKTWIIATPPDKLRKIIFGD